MRLLIRLRTVLSKHAKEGTTMFSSFVIIGLIIAIGGGYGNYAGVEILKLEESSVYFAVSAAAMYATFVANDVITWRKRREGGVFSRAIKFFLIKSPAVMLNQILYAILLKAGLHYMLAYIVCLSLITVYSFTANVLFVYQSGGKRVLESLLRISVRR